MIDNNIKAQNEFFEREGYTCTACLDPFSFSVKEKKPVQLCAKQHSYCLACFEDYRRKITSCPECRGPLTFAAGPAVPDRIQVDLMEKLWKAEERVRAATSAGSVPAAASSSAASAAASPAGANPAGKVQRVEQSPVPERFECHSLCETVWQFRSISEDIETALPTIVDVMRWQGEIQELRGEYQKDPMQWFLFFDPRDRTTKGIAQLKFANNRWEAHWSGITENNPALYVELYKYLLLSVENTQKRNDGNDWKNVSLTNYFNYDTERRWFDNVEDMLRQHHIYYDKVRLYKNWGTQIQLTAYPCCKPGHEQRRVELDPNKVLKRDEPFETWITPQVTQYFENLKLNTLFRLLALDSANAEHAANQTKIAFSREPQNFFVYTIDGQAKGYMHFLRQDGNLSVQSCKLSRDCLKYADHFIQKFVEWAKTKPIYSAGVSAKEVAFPCRDSAPVAIRDAIDNRRA